jgi:hypothetical protein
MPNFGMTIPLDIVNLYKIGNHQKVYKYNVIKF